MRNQFLAADMLACEAKRLIENLGTGPVEVELLALDGPDTVFGPDTVLKAQNSRAVAWCTMRIATDDFQLSLGEISKRFLEPAANQCAQILNG